MSTVCSTRLEEDKEEVVWATRRALISAVEVLQLKKVYYYVHGGVLYL